MNRNRLLAATLAAVLAVTALAPMGAAAATTVDGELSVSEEDGVVTVAANETVENATVTVSTVDENTTYAGAGDYTTDENGTVTLEAPTGNESVEVDIVASAGNQTAQTTATLEPTEDAGEEENFGSLVSAFVVNAKNDSDGPLGQLVASFAVDNNPGNAPDHAGPPAADDENGQGPPEHAGPSDEGEETDEDEDADGDERGNGGGPPAHAGPSA